MCSEKHSVTAYKKYYLYTVDKIINTVVEVVDAWSSSNTNNKTKTKVTTTISGKYMERDTEL